MAFITVMYSDTSARRAIFLSDEESTSIRQDDNGERLIIGWRLSGQFSLEC